MKQHAKAIMAYILAAMLAGLALADLTLCLLPSAHATVRQIIGHVLMAILAIIVTYICNVSMTERINEEKERAKEAFIKSQPGYQEKV